MVLMWLCVPLSFVNPVPPLIYGSPVGLVLFILLGAAFAYQSVHVSMLSNASPSVGDSCGHMLNTDTMHDFKSKACKAILPVVVLSVPTNSVSRHQHFHPPAGLFPATQVHMWHAHEPTTC